MYVCLEEGAGEDGGAFGDDEKDRSIQGGVR